MKNVLTILLILLNLNLSAQLQLTPVHDQCYNDTFEVGPGNMCKPLPNGNGYVVVGSSRLARTDGKQHHGTVFGTTWNHDAYIAIMDNNFNVLKSNIFGGTTTGDDDDFFTDVFPQADGGFVCFGHAESTDGDIPSLIGFTGFMFKVDSNLNKVWSSPYNKSTTSMNESDCIQSRYGGFYMLGSTPGASGDNNIDLDGNPMTFDWTLIKYDTAGNEVWAKVYGSTKDEGLGGQLAEDNAGNVYLISYSYESDNDCVSKDISWRMGLQTDEDIFVLKLDSAGNRIWTQSYGGTHAGGNTYESPFCALYDSVNNEVLIGGQSDSKDLTFSSAQYLDGDAFFLRLDTAGVVKQVRMIGGNHIDQLKHISLGPQPNTYFLGISTQSNNDGDFAGYTLRSVGGGGVDFFLCMIDQFGVFDMKYGEHNISWANGMYYSHYDPIRNEVILGGGFGADVYLYCSQDTTSVTLTGDFYKSSLRRLRFDPLSINERGFEKHSLTLYPNPSSERFYIKTDLAGNYHIEVYDLSGKLLLQGTQQETIAGIDVRGLANGIYLVQIKTTKQTIYRKLILSP